MTNEEARWILKFNRPDRPRKKDSKQLQAAIDVAIAIMEAYENLMQLRDQLHFIKDGEE